VLDLFFGVVPIFPVLCCVVALLLDRALSVPVVVGASVHCRSETDVVVAVATNQ
jgi:hypothetical protein